MKIPPSESSEDVPTPHRYTSPLDQWRQLPEWKRLWFENLSQRDLEAIFPTDQKNLDEWFRNRSWVANRRKFWDKLWQVALTASVGIAATAIASVIFMGIKAGLGK
jgi:hypothetical protein